MSEGLIVRTFADKNLLGETAAEDSARLMTEAIAVRGRARVIFSAANSQLEMAAALTARPEIDWAAVEVFHVDEYVGVSDTHPASFRRWVREQIADRVRPGKVHYLAGDAADIAAECSRYSALLGEAPVDIAFLGFGENGHIGFNDPHEADFHDPHPVRTVTLDERCRLQQVGEGHFPSLEAVPALGLTLTCPTLVNVAHVICCVPDLRKAEAVRNALEGPISPQCPGSILRTHADARLYLDRESASLLASQMAC
jgi:glucosamine-6-phosphate deaminase